MKKLALLFITTFLVVSPIYSFHHIQRLLLKICILEPNANRGCAIEFDDFKKGKLVIDDTFTVDDVMVNDIDKTKTITLKSAPSKNLLREETFIYRISKNSNGTVKEIDVISSSAKLTPLGNRLRNITLGILATGLGGAYLASIFAPSYFSYLVEKATPWLSPLREKLRVGFEIFGSP